MIQKLGQVMLYVDDQETAKEFWTEKMGFHLIEDHQSNGMRWIEIAPTEKCETTLVLHDKHVIAQMSPELNLDTPSLLFETKDIHVLYTKAKANNVIVGELVDMPTGIVFNFADEEQNYFAVRQIDEQ